MIFLSDCSQEEHGDAAKQHPEISRNHTHEHNTQSGNYFIRDKLTAR